jgi:hypothetical protein
MYIPTVMIYVIIFFVVMCIFTMINRSMIGVHRVVADPIGISILPHADLPLHHAFDTELAKKLEQHFQLHQKSIANISKSSTATDADKKNKFITTVQNQMKRLNKFFPFKKAVSSIKNFLEGYLKLNVVLLVVSQAAIFIAKIFM